MTVLIVNAIEIFAYNKNMIKAKQKSMILIVFALLIFGILSSRSSSDDRIIVIDLAKLDGDWKGSGKYLVPFTTMTASINAEAKFIYDSSGGFLRTFLTADNLLFGYSDSGHLQINPPGDSAVWDSAVWEMWNSWGYHLKYRGIVKGKTISGSRQKGKLKYDIYFEIVNYDSLYCRLILTNEKGESTEQASCYFKRIVKE